MKMERVDHAVYLINRVRSKRTLKMQYFNIFGISIEFVQHQKYFTAEPYVDFQIYLTILFRVKLLVGRHQD